MNPTEEKAKLLKELQEIETKISNCRHIFHDPIFDPETIMVGYGSVQDGAGSDPHWSFAGYEPKQRDRWSRECKVCGHKEYTYEQKPIVVGMKPNFN